MKNAIYYFTGTGNSLVVARDIAEKLGDTQVISIPHALKTGDFPEAERVGVVFPVYIWGMPLIAAKFLKRLPLRKDVYLFAVATCGGFPAATLLQAEKIIKEKGFKLSSGFGMLMPGNYIPMYGAKPPQKQAKQFKKEKEKVKKIADIVSAKKTAKIEKNNFIVNALFSGLLYKGAAKQIHKMDKNFFADEKCNSCGICEKICPVNNIKMISGKPVWQGGCEQCLACLQWCPEEAIQFGKSTSKRKRYHHPDVELSDIINR
ncbi:MAG: EFR1 family ferrodoxin [Candidatus Saganbacteria bacterium]|nr:EFR1 family ferrodoxin [Candidatus Saganbacteria bacterium]